MPNPQESHIFHDMEFVLSSIQTNYLLITFVIIYIVQILYSIVVERKRQHIVVKQRDIYYTKLLSHLETQTMDEHQELSKRINRLEHENDNIRDQLDEFDDDDGWGGKSDSNSNTSGSNRSSIDLPVHSNEQVVIVKKEQLEQELTNLQSKNDQLQSIESDVDQLCNRIGVSDLTNQPSTIDTTGPPGVSEIPDSWGPLKSLNDRIDQLEAENNRLKSQLESHKCPVLQTTPQPPLQPAPSMPQSNLDPEVVKFLEQHKADISLDFLTKAYDTLLTMKAENSERDFGQYIKDLRNGSSGYMNDLENLRIAKRTVEKKLQLMKKSYEEELSTFNDLRVEHIFKNSGAREYLEKLKERNKIKDELIITLKEDLERRGKEVVDLRDKYAEIEKKSNGYLKDLRTAQARREQLEAEKRSSNSDRRHMGRLSSASSFAEPPPPQFDNNTLNEIQRLGAHTSQVPASNSFNNLSMDNSIPPPPVPRDIDVPLNEILSSIQPPDQQPNYSNFGP